MKRQTHKRPHTQTLSIEKGCIHSGSLSASIVQASEDASIGEGEDGSLWILVHDPERRPRGHDPGVVIESDRVSFEQNGLVRVFDRRLSQDTIERLITDLTGRSTCMADSLTARSGIPAGDYAGIVVEPIGEHYRVFASGSVARRFENMQALGTNRWLVLAGEESLLRRELVQQLMPTGHRMAWALFRNGPRILVSMSALLTALSLLEPQTLPLAAVSLCLLGVLHLHKRSIIKWARQRWVQPCVDRTMFSSSI